MLMGLFAASHTGEFSAVDPTLERLPMSMRDVLANCLSTEQKASQSGTDSGVAGHRARRTRGRSGTGEPEAATRAERSAQHSSFNYKDSASKLSLNDR